MASTPRRGDTRQRIQDVALELFSEHGYEKTSLREIAERLEVTKAALYYHFKTKEDIVLSLFQDLGRPLDELIAWGEQQPRTLETKQELLRRYNTALDIGEPLMRFMQENQATVRELSIGQIFKNRMFAMSALIRDPEAPPGRPGPQHHRAVQHACADVRAPDGRRRPRGQARGCPGGRPRSAEAGPCVIGTRLRTRDGS